MDYEDLFSEVELEVMWSVIGRFRDMFPPAYGIEDLQQEVAMEIYMKRLEEGSLPRGYIWALSRSVIVDLARRARSPEINEDLDPDDLTEESDSEARVIVQEILGRVENALINQVTREGGVDRRLWDTYLSLGRDLAPTRQVLRDAGLDDASIRKFRKCVKQGLYGDSEKIQDLPAGQ